MVGLVCWRSIGKTKGCRESRLVLPNEDEESFKLSPADSLIDQSTALMQFLKSESDIANALAENAISCLEINRSAARNCSTCHLVSRRLLRFDRRIEFCVYILPTTLKLVMVRACLKFLERSDSRKRFFLLRVVTLTNATF